MRREDLVTLLPEGAVAIELGVAAGVFSAAILRSDRVSLLYSVDRWSGESGHDDPQYRTARKRLEPFGERSVVIRRPFNIAIDCFSDGIFDFIYIDGYAHTGQEDGRTIHAWWKKLKRGGIYAGHDYSLRWPLTMKAVDQFCQSRGLTMKVTDEKDEGTVWPSWYIKRVSL